MDYDYSHQTISWFRDRFKDKSLTIRPPYQRKPVWALRQKSKLVESILLRFPVPELVIDESTDVEGTTTFAIVDGQQRIRAILQFLGLDTDPSEAEFNNFALEYVDAGSPLRDKTFSELSDEEKRAFFGYKLAIRTLYSPTDAEVREMFKRLNAYLTKLNDQELRNATYSGPFVELVSDLADDKYWTENGIFSPANIRRMKDVQFVSELFIGMIYGPQAGSAKAIDDYYAYFEEFEDEIPQQQDHKKLYEKTLLFVQELLPEIRKTRWSNQTDFYTLFVALASISKTEDISPTERVRFRKRLDAFAAEIDRRLADEHAKVSAEAIQYVRAVEKGSSDKARRAARHQALLAVLRPGTGAKH